MASPILAGHINTLADARYLNALETQVWLGFNMDVLQPNYLAPEECRNICQWLYQPNIIAAFGMHQGQEEILFLSECIGARAIQLPDGHPLSESELPIFTFIYHWMPDLNAISNIKHYSGRGTIIDYNPQKLDPGEIYNHQRADIILSLLGREATFLRLPNMQYPVTSPLLQPYGWYIPVTGNGLPDDYSDLIDSIL